MSGKGFKQDWFMPAVIFAVAFMLVVNTIPNGYSLDDTYVAQNNPRVMKGIAGIPEIFTSRYVDEEGNSFGYRPVAMATFAIEQELWGQNPHMGHLINAMLYALCSMLLFFVLRKIFRESGWLFPCVAALLFAAHPIHTEVTASLKNRETLLSFLFSLVSLSLFLKWFDTQKAGPAIAGLLAFAVAFLSKQDAVTFAAVIPLAILFYSPHPIRVEPLNNLRRLLFSRQYRYLGFAGLSFIFFYATTRGLGAVFSTIAYFSTLTFLFLHHHRLGKISPEYGRNRFSWIFMGSGVLLFLLALVASDVKFAFLSLLFFALFFARVLESEQFRKFRFPATWQFLLIPVVVLGLAAVIFYKLPDLYLPPESKVVYHFENPQFMQAPGYSTGPMALYTLFFYLKKLVWPHPLGFYYGYRMIPEVSWTTPEVIFSILFHLGILAFALWKLPKKHILSFAVLYYLATISIFTNIVIKIPGIAGERLAFFPSLGFCIALAWGMFKLLRISPETERIPRSKAMGLSFALLLVLIPYSAKTITRNRDWKDYLTLFLHDAGYLANSAKANHTYASQLLKEAYNNDVKNPSPDVQHEYLELAVQHLKKTVEIDSSYKFAWNNLGFITVQYLGKQEEGIRYLLKAVGIDPDYGEAHFNLGYAYKQQKDFGQSIHHYREARRIKPGNLLYLTEEADAWFRSGNRDTALLLYDMASRMDLASDGPLISMGNIYWLAGDTLNAIASWEKAFERNPSNRDICRNLAGYFSSVGDSKAAWYSSKMPKPDR